MEFRQDVQLGLGRSLSPPLMNGGGCCKTVENVRELSRSLAGAVVLGSITKEERSGNPGNVWWVGADAALNSLGMPNGRSQFPNARLRQTMDLPHHARK